MAIRVLHWGTGPTGCAAFRGILGHPDLELVGLYVARPERAGRDAGAFVGLPDTGIVATNDLDELRAIDADVLSYFGPMVASVDDVIPFLRDGIDVVTTTYASLILPAHAPQRDRRTGSGGLPGGKLLAVRHGGRAGDVQRPGADHPAHRGRRAPLDPGDGDRELQRLPGRDGDAPVGLRRAAGRAPRALRPRARALVAGRPQPRRRARRSSSTTSSLRTDTADHRRRRPDRVLHGRKPARSAPSASRSSG